MSAVAVNERAVTAPIVPVSPLAPVAPVAPVGPVGPAAPVAPVAPVAPLGPAGIWPIAKSFASSTPSLTLADVTELEASSAFLTALDLICALPTLLLGSLIAA